MCSLLALHCAPRPNTNRVVVVADPGEVQTFQEFCARACAGHAPPGTQLVECHAVTLASEITEKLNHDSQNGAACEFR